MVAPIIFIQQVTVFALMYALFYMLTCTKPRSMNGINASWDIVRESDIEIDFTDLMRTRKAVNFIEKYNRVSVKAIKLR